MSNSENNRLTGVILDQTLFILENYIEIMTIFHNTQAQITRQHQAMVRKMNVLLTELRRQQSIDTISENIRSSFGSLVLFKIQTITTDQQIMKEKRFLQDLNKYKKHK